MLSEQLVTMVKDAFTKYGEFVPEAHKTAVVSVCGALVSDPNAFAYQLMDTVTLNYAVASQISAHWGAQAKFAESKLKTIQARANIRVRERLRAEKEKKTVDEIASLTLVEEDVITAQYSADVSSELAQVTKTLTAAVRMKHESLVERTRTERQESKVVG